jgi:hypothetical protein
MDIWNNIGAISKAEQNKILKKLNADLTRILWEKREGLAPRDRVR